MQGDDGRSIDYDGFSCAAVCPTHTPIVCCSSPKVRRPTVKRFLHHDDIPPQRACWAARACERQTRSGRDWQIISTSWTGLLVVLLADPTAPPIIELRAGG